MKNIWIQHLEKHDSEENLQDPSFVEMLHSLVRMENEDDVRTVVSKSAACKNTQYGLKDGREYPEFNAPLKEDTIKGKEDASDDCKVMGAGTEICMWTAKSQQGYEMGMDSYDDDHVRLVRSQNGKLVLMYNVAGEDNFEIGVNSTEEADRLILEDNMTTLELYPDNPELQWSKK
ncbi:MAG: hypothetical protein JW705_07955 [Methanosarcinaceae archaeon]|nr:hypothetical protein [Methanosarcinaceae archaeon]